MDAFHKKPLMAVEDAPDERLPASMGAFDLMMLGVGGTIGTGIFVLTSEGAQKAGPAMIASFLIAGVICGVSALCYAELATMIPRAGSAYTYAYIALGEVPAWTVGWALILEYAVTAAAVAVGWSGYLSGELQSWFHWTLPPALAGGPFAGGIINCPAALLTLAVTGMLCLGTRESARINTVLVVLKLLALLLFVSFTLPAVNRGHFVPFAPLGWSSHRGAGVLGGGASIFFAYVGFDSVSTAAEETRNPQRNVPIGLLGALSICALVYALVATGVVGSPLGAQPLLSTNGKWIQPGSEQMMQRCAQFVPQSTPIACSSDGLAYVMRSMNHPTAAVFIALAAFFALRQ